MKMNIAFSENPQAIDVDFAEDPARWTGEFGQIQVLHDGQNGATFTPSVSPDGVLSWTNDRKLPNPVPVNIKGEKGDKGDKGDRGLQGDQGIQGERGEQGQKGEKGEKGEKGDPGTNGKDGADGQPGKDGQDGYTPVKGTDYFTAADKAEMVSAVISALPKYNGEVVSV